MTARTAGVIATRNQRDYIGEAVGSLASQVDELVVVDDASTDGTAEVVEGLAPNVTVLRNPERLGVSLSFTRAVEAASAELIVISGGDDVSLPGRVASQAALLEDPGVSLVSSPPRVIDALGRLLPGDVAGEFLVKPPEVPALEFLYFETNFVCAPAAALRRADSLRLGGFPPYIDLLQDHALWLELAAIGEVVIAEAAVVSYRKHSSNLSREYVGLDTPRGRRRGAERDWLLDAFLARADAGVRRRLAASRGIDTARFAALADLEQIALIQVNHPDPLVVRRGLSRVFDIATRPGGDARLAAMGLTTADLDGIAIAADHQNLTAVVRALGLAKGSTT